MGQSFGDVRSVRPAEGMNEVLVGGNSVLAGGALRQFGGRLREAEDRRLWERMRVGRLTRK